MQYETDSGLIVNDRRHSRSNPDDPRSWPPNDNDPGDGTGAGPDSSDGAGNTTVMYQGEQPDVMTSSIGVPSVQAWSGWPVEWSTPNWGTSVGITQMIQRVSTVFGAIDMNASILSTMPPYRLAGRTVVDPLPWMTNPQPEVYTGWIEALHQVVTSFYCGEAFLWCTSRYSDGTVRNWVMLEPSWVDVKMMGQIRRYYMQNVDITEDVLHLRYTSWPGQPHGIGPLAALATNLFGVTAMERYQSNLAVRGGIPWAVLTAPGNLTKDQATTLRENFVTARMSAAGAPATLSGGVTLEALSISPKDMALIELRQFEEARIATLLGVPPLLMGLPSGDSMTYKNAEGIYDFHWRAYLRPKAAAIMEAISHWALPSTQSVELNRDEYVRPAFAERVEGYSKLFAILDPLTGKRGITVDEIRQAERLAVLDNTQPVPPELMSPIDQTAGQEPADQAAQ